MQKASFSPCAFVTLGSRSLGQDTKFISHTIHQGSYQMKITPTSLTVNQLLGSTNEQYVIPTYQRRYSWHERQVVELIEDIALIESGDTHLLGSIVCLAGHHKAGLNSTRIGGWSAAAHHGVNSSQLYSGAAGKRRKSRRGVGSCPHADCKTLERQSGSQNRARLN